MSFSQAWTYYEDGVRKCGEADDGYESEGCPCTRSINMEVHIFYIMHGMDKCGLEESDAHDRITWRRIVQNSDLASSMDKEYEEINTIDDNNMIMTIGCCHYYSSQAAL